MKKIYAAGTFSAAEIASLRDFCQEKGWSLITVRAFGRPRRSCDVVKLLDAYRATGSIRGTSRLLDIPPGSVRTILSREGMLKDAKQNKQEGLVAAKK
jgi:molybdenum-dependent DNA-binding transcriptional regulator ModE